MKYNRLTERRERRKSITRWWTNDGESLKMYKRLAKLEDKIEAGKLISTVQNEQGEQEIEFFVKHNAAVRKQAVKQFAERVKLAFYYEFDELIPSIMADKIDALVKEVCGE